MKRRNFVLGMGAVATGGSALLGSGAFSDVDSQRTVRTETVGDENAYLGLVYPEINVDCAGSITLVTITNQSKEPLTNFDVDDVSVDGGTIENTQTPDSLAVGESGAVTADAECTGTGTATVTFTVEATGSETSVIAEDRSNSINCNCQSTTGISFVAFCGDVNESDIDYTVYPATDSVEWECAGTIDSLVLYGGLGSYTPQGPHFLNFHDPASNGMVSVGDEDETVAKDETPQSPNCPSPDSANSGVKFDIDDYGNEEGVDENICS